MSGRQVLAALFGDAGDAVGEDMRDRGSKCPAKCVMIGVVSILFPCPMTVEAYHRAGRNVHVPRLKCPRCCDELTFDGSYPRTVRDGHGEVWTIRIRRGRCCRCDRSEALLPDFVVPWRLDTVDAIGASLIDQPTPTPAPLSTRRAWRRRYRANEHDLQAGFSACCVVLGLHDWLHLRSTRPTAAAIGACWHAASRRTSGCNPPPWRLANLITGGTLIATRVNRTWLVIGAVPGAGPEP